MRRLFPIFVLGLGILFINGCGTTSVYNLPQSQQEGLVRQSYMFPTKPVFETCLDLLTEDGWIIDNIDRQSGLITTEWKQNTSIFEKVIAGDSRSRQSVRVTGNGDHSTVKVILYLQHKDSDGWSQYAISKNEAKQEISPFLESIGERLVQANNE